MLNIQVLVDDASGLPSMVLSRSRTKRAQRSGVVLECLLVISLLFGGCGQPSDGRLTHQLTIVVGGHIRDIDAGKLVVYLFAYDPYLADAPADELDKHELLFQHRQGKPTITSVVLAGDVPHGYRPYVVVRG